MPKFTKSYIESLPIHDRIYEVWDTEVKGLGCMVNTSGKKTYYFLYRLLKGTKKQRLKIGVHGNITCDIARDIARGWMGDIVRGIDPKEHLKKQESNAKQSITLEAFLNLFVEKYKKVQNKESTINRDSYRLNNVIIPFFGNLKVYEVSVVDILRFQDHLKNTPIQFNRCASILSKAFNIAELWGYRHKNSNPCHGIKKYKERKKERFLTIEELERLEKTLEMQDKFKISSPYTIGAIRLLMYTGCRLGEILNLRWDDVFLKDGYLHLTDSKTGERKIPLNESAKNVLLKLKRQEENPYVFVGVKVGACLTNLTRGWIKIRCLAGLEDVRIHDLRHTFASLAIKQGVDLYTVSKLLGHKNIATTTRYAHLEMEHLIKATNIVDQVWQKERVS